MDKTRDSTTSKIWPDSTCAISVRRKGQILLVVESLVLSTTHNEKIDQSYTASARYLHTYKMDGYHLSFLQGK